MRFLGNIIPWTALGSCPSPDLLNDRPYRRRGSIASDENSLFVQPYFRWNIIAPKVPFRNTDLEKECPLRPSVDSRPIRSSLTPCTGWTPSTSSEALPFAQEVRKTRGDAPRRPDTAAQAPGDSLGSPYRVHAQIASVRGAPALRPEPPGVSLSLSRRRCIFQILSFLGSVLSVCPQPPDSLAQRPVLWMDPVDVE